jgi:hypothetical protein
VPRGAGLSLQRRGGVLGHLVLTALADQLLDRGQRFLLRPWCSSPAVLRAVHIPRPPRVGCVARVTLRATSAHGWILQRRGTDILLREVAHTGRARGWAQVAAAYGKSAGESMGDHKWSKGTYRYTWHPPVAAQSEEERGEPTPRPDAAPADLPGCRRCRTPGHAGPPRRTQRRSWSSSRSSQHDSDRIGSASSARSTRDVAVAGQARPRRDQLRRG